MEFVTLNDSAVSPAAGDCNKTAKAVGDLGGLCVEEGIAQGSLKNRDKLLSLSFSIPSHASVGET
jgi:hypothetical protein